jgi:hypothetical protein
MTTATSPFTFTLRETEYLLARAQLRLSPPQLDEMTRALTQPAQVTPLALAGWHDVSADWLEMAYEDGDLSYEE